MQESALAANPWGEPTPTEPSTQSEKVRAFILVHFAQLENKNHGQRAFTVELGLRTCIGQLVGCLCDRPAF